MQRLPADYKELESTVLDFRTESETDYQVSAEQLSKAEAQSDKYKNRYENALRELAQRSERVKQLEQQHKEATEMTKHMNIDHQVSI